MANVGPGGCIAPCAALDGARSSRAPVRRAPGGPCEDPGVPGSDGNRGAAARLPVAVFDSGVGGLTVLHECLVSLPEEDYVYLGDTAHFPYGDRPPDELRALSLELAGSLVERGAKLLVVACNSATAAALDALRDAFAGRVEVIGVVDPESRVAAAATRSGRVGLLATQATVASGAYE